MPLRILAALLLALLAAPVSRAAAPPPPMITQIDTQQAGEIDALARAAVQDKHIPGLSLAVVQDGTVVYAQGYGAANLQFLVPAGADTIYPIGSLTKQFTAAAIMLLVQSGKLRTLDQPFAPLLPRLKLPAAWRAITVRELLNQTSGLAAYTSYASTNPDRDPFLKSYTPQEVVDLIKAKRLGFAPGTRFEYCNTNYWLLGEIVAEQSGEAYDAFLRDKLFSPLGMTDTGKYDPWAVVSRRASGYLLSQGTVYNNVLATDADFPGGAGELQSSALDLARWDAALYTDAPLSAASKQMMWTAPRLSERPPFAYGFGWIMDEVNGHRLIWHNGAIAGAGSWMGRYVDDKLTVIVQCNGFSLDSPTAFVYQLAALGERVAGVVNPALMPQTVAEGTGGAASSADIAVCRKVFDAVLAGHADASSFTPDAAKALFPGAIAQTRSIWLALGGLQKFEAVGERTTGAYKIVRCRCVFAEAALVYDFAFEKATGKIGGILPVKGAE